LIRNPQSAIRNGVRAQPAPWAGLVVLLALTGCRSKTEQISSTEYLLPLLHGYWNDARRVLRAGDPNLNVFRAIHVNLRGRVMESVKNSYPGKNKQEVIVKLQAITEAFQAQIAPKLELWGQTVQLRPGVRLEDLRQAFDKIDPEYRQLEAMTSL
jgi:hypothetical protein